jgi:hypothetical protein
MMGELDVVECDLSVAEEPVTEADEGQADVADTPGDGGDRCWVGWRPGAGVASGAVDAPAPALSPY